MWYPFKYIFSQVTEEWRVNLNLLTYAFEKWIQSWQQETNNKIIYLSVLLIQECKHLLENRITLLINLTITYHPVLLPSTQIKTEKKRKLLEA